MEEVLVSYKNSKLAKQFGFNWKTLCYYVNEQDETTFRRGKTSAYWNDPMMDGDDTTLGAPTQCLLLKWLRESLNVDISVRPNGNLTIVKNNVISTIPKQKEYIWSIYVKNKDWTGTHHNTHVKYEDAVEKAIEAAFKIMPTI